MCLDSRSSALRAAAHSTWRSVSRGSRSPRHSSPASAPTSMATCSSARSTRLASLSSENAPVARRLPTQNWALTGRPNTRSPSNGIRIRWPTWLAMAGWMPSTSGRSEPSSNQDARSSTTSWTSSHRACAPSIPTSDRHWSGSRTEARARVESIARHVDVVKLSDEDASWLYPGVEVGDVISSLLALGPELVALTRGAEGSVIATRRHRLQVPAPRVRVVDTIGAGDAYMSALLGALILNDAAALGLSDLPADALLDIGAMASRAAAFVVKRAGSHPPTFEQLRS